jgi:uncharacterized protein
MLRITNIGIFSFLSLAGLSIGLLTFFDSGFRGIILLILGIILGITFLFFQYGFASGWRNLIEKKNSSMISHHFLLAAICCVFFIPIIDLNSNIIGSYAPVNFSLVLGAFMFGFGMQLANGCGSGVLFTFGSGSGRMLVALPFFVIGSVLGTFVLPFVIDILSLGQIIIAKDNTLIMRTIINSLALFFVFLLFYFYARKNNFPINRKVTYGTFIIAVLCVLVLFFSGSPWGVTYGFTIWGAKISQSIGIPVETFTFWNWPGPKRSLQHSVLSDISSLMNIGMIIGAGFLASINGLFRSNNWPSSIELLSAAIGGILMGIGARLSFGCNIGAFLGGTASGSLHGWIWFVMAFIGTYFGIKYRKLVGFK